MKKVIRLTEADLNKIVKRIIAEDNQDKEDFEWWKRFGFDTEEEFVEDYIKADNYAGELQDELVDEIRELFIDFLEHIDLGSIVKKYQSMFYDKYPKYTYTEEEFENENIDLLMRGRNDIDMDYLNYDIEEAWYNYLFDSKGR